MHPQEERFEHIKDELEKAGIDFDEYRYEEGALEIFSSYSSLKKLAPWCLSRIHIEYERIIFRDEECIQFFREQRAEELRVSNDKFKYPTNDKNSDPGVKLNNC